MATETRLITINLKRVAAFIKGKDGKAIEDFDPHSGGIKCKQDDNWGLLQILGRFDSHLHPVSEWKTKLQIVDKLWEVFKKRDEKKAADLKLDLTLDEAAFLKSYLVNIPEKECKGVNIEEYETRTIIEILEQLK